MTDLKRLLRLTAAAGAGALIATGALTACASEEEQAPETTTTTTTTTTSPGAPTVAPTEKAPRIDSGPNQFSPTVTATPAPEATPGRHR